MPIPLRKCGLSSPVEPSSYPKKWNAISKAFREEHKYKCAICGVDCSDSEHHHLIDVHHMNGIKSDCRYKNLQCLCKICHAEQDFHSHYKINESDHKTLLQLSKNQGIDIKEQEALCKNLSPSPGKNC